MEGVYGNLRGNKIRTLLPCHYRSDLWLRFPVSGFLFSLSLLALFQFLTLELDTLTQWSGDGYYFSNFRFFNIYFVPVFGIWQLLPHSVPVFSYLVQIYKIVFFLNIKNLFLKNNYYTFIFNYLYSQYICVQKLCKN